jgi:capsular exopolysaccharide synthesis family protein
MVHSDYLQDQQWDPAKSEAPIKEVLLKYLTRWPWFLAGMILALGGGFSYLYLAIPKYEAQATILIRDDSKGGGGLNELVAFEDLGILTRKSNLENEIEILKSRTIMLRVVHELGLNFRYYTEKQPRNKELFNSLPFTMAMADSAQETISSLFYLEQLSADQFLITDLKGRNPIKIKAGVPFKSEAGLMIIRNNIGGRNAPSGRVLVQTESAEKTATAYAARLKIEPADAKSNVIRIKLKDPVQAKAVDILQSLIRQYRIDAIEDKNQVSMNTSAFINERIQFITGELAEVESNVQNYKTGNKLVDLTSASGIILESEAAVERDIIQAGIQKQLAGYVLDYLSSANTSGGLLPANLGLSDAPVAVMIAEYNKLVLERSRVLKNSSENNPIAAQIQEQIINLKTGIGAALKNLVQTQALKEKNLRDQAAVIGKKITSVPRFEREFREIQRQQQIKESLYLYLLQKREETAIALAVTISNAKVIDPAKGSGEIVSPDRKVVFSISILLGLLLPAGLIYMRNLLDTKVHGRKDLARSDIPILGEIPNSGDNEKLVVKPEDRSGISEAFRSLRTNISFMLNRNLGKAPVVFITSTLAKEGKTFLAINLAAITAATGKRVLLAGLDLRTPRILEYLNMPASKGITNHLIDASSKIEDFILPVSETNNLYVLPSGDIPPNPAELLLSERMGEIFGVLRNHFDYIVVDTAPAGLVTDTILASGQADVIIYVLRAGLTDKNTLSIPETLFREKKLPNMAYLINDARHSGTYGYAYGYGYGLEEKKVWWRRSLKKMK